MSIASLGSMIRVGVRGALTRVAKGFGDIGDAIDAHGAAQAKELAEIGLYKSVGYNGRIEFLPLRDETARQAMIKRADEKLRELAMKN